MIFVRTFKYLIFFDEKWTKDILFSYVNAYVYRRLNVYECSRVHSYINLYLCVTGTIVHKHIRNKPTYVFLWETVLRINLLGE